MDAYALQEHARDLLAGPAQGPVSDQSEAALRRALSPSYYALFHTLTSVAAQAFAPGGSALQNQVARAFNHSGMRKVCDAYVRSPTRPFPPLLAQLSPSPPDLRVIGIAKTFALLQDARHSADYDLSAAFDLAGVTRLVQAVETALTDFRAVQVLPETAVFLTALLLADRWTRRG